MQQQQKENIYFASHQIMCACVHVYVRFVARFQILFIHLLLLFIDHFQKRDNYKHKRNGEEKKNEQVDFAEHFGPLRALQRS